MDSDRQTGGVPGNNETTLISVIGCGHLTLTEDQSPVVLIVFSWIW